MSGKIKLFINSYWILLLLVVIKMILQYVVVNPAYELHRDEFLYLDQGNHLAFGYISVPPFTALISKGILLLGGGMFWVHFFPAFFGALTIIFTWLIVESLEGSLFSKILASCALLFSPLIRMNILFQPNSFDILAWTVIFYLLIRFFQTEKNKWLFVLAVVVAAGFYNKYNMIFLIAGLAVGLLLTYHRKMFLRPSFWLAVILSLILLLPNIYWQVKNDLPVFEHMKVLKVNQLDNNTASGFFKSQVLFFIGSLPLTIGALVALFTFKSLKPYRFVGITFVAVMLLFALMRAKDYYAVGLFPVVIAFGSVFFDSILKKNHKLIIFPLLILMNLTVFIATLNLVYPLLSPAEIRQNAKSFEKMGLLRWEDGKNHNLPQDFADMLGWREMAEKALAAYKMLPPDELDNTLIICDNYGQAGAVNYYNRKKMPEAYAFNTDYIYWLPQLKSIRNILLVGEKPEDEIINLFSNFKMTGVVENAEAREKGTAIYLLTGANELFTAGFYKEVEERKENLDIF